MQGGVRVSKGSSQAVASSARGAEQEVTRPRQLGLDRRDLIAGGDDDPAAAVEVPARKVSLERESRREELSSHVQVLRLVDGGQPLQLIGRVEMSLLREPSSEPTEGLGSVVETIGGGGEVGGGMRTCSGYFLHERDVLVASSRDEVEERLASANDEDGQQASDETREQRELTV